MKMICVPYEDAASDVILFEWLDSLTALSNGVAPYQWTGVCDKICFDRPDDELAFTLRFKL